jgi:hypothetical protein
MVCVTSKATARRPYMFGGCGAAANCEAAGAPLRESMIELGEMIGLQGGTFAGPAA